MRERERERESYVSLRVRGFCKREGILGITRLQSEKNKAVREKRERIEAVCAGKVETFFFSFFNCCSKFQKNNVFFKFLTRAYGA